MDESSAIIGTAIIVALSGLWYIGVFDKIEFQEGEDSFLGPAKFFYKNHSGPYSQSGKHFEDIDKFLASRALQHFKKAGIYYDDPKTTTTRPTRYAAGFLVNLEEGKGGQEEQIVGKMDDILKEFQVMTIDKTRTISSTFPMRAGSLSFALSAMKTYPAFLNKGYKMMCGSVEVYACEKIETHFPLEKFERFIPVNEQQ
eukprot:CAMPEP_0176489590 /NCGR_PEP_ID=MMETSP0200_2-20121128/7375_1 /TAXON_ID=947934 /ORGANISM="Chaetoceros sp., Strain GSL56" /LENGTH=198 /DNA_ID=CAMNT_0017886753 /DNA_START=89 /DNA_END=685 /DNA_ORIENTATION=-